MLQNPNFEAEWQPENGHQCLIVPVDSPSYVTDIGNIFTPPGWLSWYHHDPGTFDQPEIRDAWKHADERRVRSGDKATLLFTFFRAHDAGFLQQVQVTPGTSLRLTAWAHAWSNHQDKSQPEKFPHPDDPRWSEGPGYNVGFKLEGETPDDNWRNFTFSIGIDPAGGTDPLADTVTWGQGAHIYNEYAQVPLVEATAQSDTVTVFLRSKTLWPFKHSDAYWDDVYLVEIDGPPDPPSGRGSPRVQYERTFVLFPPTGTVELLGAALEAWEEHRFTIGGSADDAGIGDLDHRKIIAVNPNEWPDGADALGAFYDQYYPGVDFVPVTCTEDDIAEKIASVIGGDPEPPEPQPPTGMSMIGLHVQVPSADSNGFGDVQYVEVVKPSVMKLVGNMEHAHHYKAVSPDTLVVYRQWTAWQDYYKEPDLEKAAWDFLRTFLDSLLVNADYIDFAEGLNEVALQCGFVDARFIEFERQFAVALHDATGGAVRPLLGGIAVGNPEHRPAPDFEQMLPMIEIIVEYNGALNYHGYIRCLDGVVDWDDEYHYSMRALESMDPYFTSRGLHPKYILGETGAFVNAKDGWRKSNCLSGDKAAYAALLREFDTRIKTWNVAHGDRCLGGTIFTCNASRDDWRYYDMHPDLAYFADELKSS